MSQRTSQATLTPTSLPDGCSYGEIPSKVDGQAAERVIWVDFPPDSRDNPFYFSRRRKVGITMCALIYCAFCCRCSKPACLTTAMTASAFAVQSGPMCEDLKCYPLGAATGIAMYAWGAALMPLVVAPVSEEIGRRP